MTASQKKRDCRIGICGVGAYVLIFVANKPEASLSDAGTALVGFGNIIGAIVILPQIIANHLYLGNSEEIRFHFSGAIMNSTKIYQIRMKLTRNISMMIRKRLTVKAYGRDDVHLDFYHSTESRCYGRNLQQVHR